MWFGSCVGQKLGGPEVGAGGLGVSLRVTVTACARGHALPTCSPARHQHSQHSSTTKFEIFTIQSFYLEISLVKFYTVCTDLGLISVCVWNFSIFLRPTMMNFVFLMFLTCYSSIFLLMEDIN